MKKYYSIICILITSCSSKYIQIGHLNMISTRNISSNERYESLQKYSNSSTRQIFRSQAKTVQDAIDNTVKSVPGGEYLMNVKLYRNKKGRYAAEGDVWGIPGQDINGIRVNQSVFIVRRGKSIPVKVLSFIDKDRVYIKFDDDKIEEVEITRLITSE